MWGAGLSLDRWKVPGAEPLPNDEGCTDTVAMRDSVAPAGSKAASRIKGQVRNTGGPAAAIGVVPDGGVATRGDRSGAPRRGWESDRPIVPSRPPKETRRAEERGRRRGISGRRVVVRTQSWIPRTPGLVRVKEAARQDRHARFTALLHHVDRDALERAFGRIRPGASPGVDGQTVAIYAEDLEARLDDLCTRVHTGAYRPQPVRRVQIPKAGGGLRPLGVPALEDKIVQSAVAEVLSAVYEVDFLGFSYGFRPGRSPHMGLTALHTALMSQRVSWVLDADLRGFFDSVDHEWLLRMLAHRIADRRVLQLIQLWLKAGFLEEGRWQATRRGTPQGAGISPLLANVYLHYALDLWVQQWRVRHARGQVVVVRYADDFVLGFEVHEDAERMWAALRDRLQRFGLALHPEKTRLIDFGRRPSMRRERWGERRCATFQFLGMTHYCGRTRDGRFMVQRKTQSQRMTRKLNQLRREAKRRMHLPVADQRHWLARVLHGHYAYYGIAGNIRAIHNFYQQVLRLWHRALRRRSQRRMTWLAFMQLCDRLPLPPPRLTHGWTVMYHAGLR